MFIVYFYVRWNKHFCNKMFIVYAWKIDKHKHFRQIRYFPMTPFRINNKHLFRAKKNKQFLMKFLIMFTRRRQKQINNKQKSLFFLRKQKININISAPFVPSPGITDHEVSVILNIWKSKKFRICFTQKTKGSKIWSPRAHGWVPN